MKVCISGASGFLGRHVMAWLSAHGYDIIGLTRNTQLAAKSNELIWSDYSFGMLREQLDGCGALVHLAGLRQGSAPTEKVYNTNIQLTESLYNISRSVGITKVVYASSISVYDSQANPPFSEDLAEIEKSETYGLSKYKCEGLAGKYGLNAVNLRFGQIIGRGERKGYMLSTFIESAFARAPIYLWGSEYGSRDYLYIKDAAIAVEKALNLNSTGTLALNISNGIPINHEHLAYAISEEIAGAESLVFRLAEKPADISVRYMDISKAQTILNWMPRYTLREALRDIGQEIGK